MRHHQQDPVSLQTRMKADPQPASVQLVLLVEGKSEVCDAAQHSSMLLATRRVFHVIVVGDATNNTW